MNTISLIKQRLELLWQMVEKLEGGSSNYNSLNNKPQINGIQLQGNKTSADLGIPNASNYYTKDETAAEIMGAITDIDVSSTPISGHYIKSIEQVDGAINAVAETYATSPVNSSTKLITSGGVYEAIQPFVPFSTPTAIASNSDLNTLKPNNSVPAYYLCASSDIASSLSNCPTTNPFILISLPTSDGKAQKRVQIIISAYSTTATTSNIIYWRIADNDSLWSNWYSIEGTKIV